MKRAFLISVVGLGLAIAGCGESDEDKAKNAVCDARADIQKNVKDLQNLNVQTATADGVKSNVTAIQDDLKTISDNQDELDDTRKQQVQKANETFTSEVESLSNDLGSSQSLPSAGQQLKSDIANLATAYQQALAPIDCG